jgi:hypothetical protein
MLLQVENYLCAEYTKVVIVFQILLCLQFLATLVYYLLHLFWH